MPRIAPLALLLLLPACSDSPLAVIPPAQLALMSSQVEPVAPAAPAPTAPMQSVDPLALSFQQALCAEAAAAGASGLASCQSLGSSAAPLTADHPSIADPVIAPAAISVEAMLATIRDEATRE